MSKADNLLSILWLLKTGKRKTAQQLADALEINIRTVYRYIDSLCASGVPIISDSGHNGGYSLLREFTETPLFFELNEQKALIHAAKFAEEAGYPFTNALKSAISKLKRQANEEQLDAIDRHDVGFEVITSPGNAALESILQQLEISVAEGYTVEMEYHKGSEPSARFRKLNPYGLVNWKHKWYVVGYCHLREEIRSFRVDRILGLSHTDDHFQRPEGFSARTYFINSLLPASDNQELISVQIQGKPQAINDLSEHWLLGHVLVERTRDYVHFKVDEQAIQTIVPYFLITYGKAIEILEPQMLKDRMVKVAADLLQYYQR